MDNEPLYWGDRSTLQRVSLGNNSSYKASEILQLFFLSQKIKQNIYFRRYSNTSTRDSITNYNSEEKAELDLTPVGADPITRHQGAPQSTLLFLLGDGVSSFDTISIFEQLAMRFFTPPSTFVRFCTSAPRRVVVD